MIPSQARLSFARAPRSAAEFVGNSKLTLLSQSLLVVPTGKFNRTVPPWINSAFHAVTRWLCRQSAGAIRSPLSALSFAPSPYLSARWRSSSSSAGPRGRSLILRRQDTPTVCGRESGFQNAAAGLTKRRRTAISAAWRTHHNILNAAARVRDTPFRASQARSSLRSPACLCSSHVVPPSMLRMRRPPLFSALIGSACRRSGRRGSRGSCNDRPG